MYTRYYDGYTQRNNNPPCKMPEPEAVLPAPDISEETHPQAEIASVKSSFLPFNLDMDDIILIAVLFLVASESCDDFILPLILGYLLLSNK